MPQNEAPNPPEPGHSASSEPALHQVSLASAASTASNAVSRAQRKAASSAIELQRRLLRRGKDAKGTLQASTSDLKKQAPNASSLLSKGDQEPQREADGQSQEMEEAPWRRRIAGISDHLRHPFQNAHKSANQIEEAFLQGLVVNAEVSQALKAGRPVVALESTIISHGMPYPQNLSTAQAVEGIVRENGAVPATVAIIAGRPHVGLDADQLKHIAQSGVKVKKTSRRDLPFVIANKQDGATTVSATMMLASKAGIHVFVTGGIGGVHRGAESTMDISSDLTEFSKSPIAVVCAGAKSILDIPKTLEYLETQGVPVAAYGTDEFPAFFTPRSGCRAPARIDGPQQAAVMIQASKDCNLNSGILIGVPIPEDLAAEGGQVEAAIQQALKECQEQQLSGAETTPFLLKCIQQLTRGKSLDANIALIKHNASVGAQIASALSHLDKG